jgi:hypothetical protein
MLQEDLDQIYSWAEDIGMQFNAGKFELVRFWLDHDKAPDILYMAPDGGPIEEKNSLRDPQDLQGQGKAPHAYPPPQPYPAKAGLLHPDVVPSLSGFIQKLELKA